MVPERVERYEEVKSVLAQITETLKRSDLTPAERQELQLHAAALSGQLMRPWLPVYWSRRLIMLAIVAFGIQQAVWESNYQPFLYWLILPFFSPRIVGEAAGFFGSIAGYFDRLTGKRN